MKQDNPNRTRSIIFKRPDNERWEVWAIFLESEYNDNYHHMSFLIPPKLAAWSKRYAIVEGARSAAANECKKRNEGLDLLEEQKDKEEFCTQQKH